MLILKKKKFIYPIIIGLVIFLCSMVGAIEPDKEYYEKILKKNLPNYIELIDYQIQAEEKLGNNIDKIFASRFKAKVKNNENLYQYIKDKYQLNKHGIQPGLFDGNPINREISIPEELFDKIEIFKPKPISRSVRFLQTKLIENTFFEIYGKTTAKMYRDKLYVKFEFDGDPFSYNEIGLPFSQFKPEEHGLIISGSDKESEFYSIINKYDEEIAIKKEDDERFRRELEITLKNEIEKKHRQFIKNVENANVILSGYWEAGWASNRYDFLHFTEGKNVCVISGNYKDIKNGKFDEYAILKWSTVDDLFNLKLIKRISGGKEKLIDDKSKDSNYEYSINRFNENNFVVTPTGNSTFNQKINPAFSEGDYKKVLDVSDIKQLFLTVYDQEKKAHEHKAEQGRNLINAKNILTGYWESGYDKSKLLNFTDDGYLHIIDGNFKDINNIYLNNHYLLKWNIVDQVLKIKLLQIIKGTNTQFILNKMLDKEHEYIFNTINTNNFVTNQTDVNKYSSFNIVFSGGDYKKVADDFNVKSLFSKIIEHEKMHENNVINAKKLLIGFWEGGRGAQKLYFTDDGYVHLISGRQKNKNDFFIEEYCLLKWSIIDNTLKLKLLKITNRGNSKELPLDSKDNERNYIFNTINSNNFYIQKKDSDNHPWFDTSMFNLHFKKVTDVSSAERLFSSFSKKQ